MPSSFVQHYTESVSVASRQQLQVLGGSSTPRKDYLRSLISDIQNNGNITQLIDKFCELEQTSFELSASTDSADAEEIELRDAVLSKLSVSIYGEALDMYLKEACELEAEAEWWADIERSRRRTLLYLLQTLPVRILSLSHTIVERLRTENLPINPSNLTPSSLRRLFTSNNTFRPNALTASMFPHLRTQSSIHTLAMFPPRHSVLSNITSSFGSFYRATASCLTIPTALTRQECSHKRVQLEAMRDDRANILGELSFMRRQLSDALADPEKLNDFLIELGVKVNADSALPQTHILRHLSRQIFPAHVRDHTAFLKSRQLLRPSRLTQLWPRLVFLPPFILFSIKTLYSSRESLFALANDTQETLIKFVRGWLLEPLQDVIRTVRAGRDGGVIIRKEGIAADFASLERMAISLAQDKLLYDSQQLSSLSEQIRMGDLTPVLQVYEDDIKRPLRSALTGTLLRSVFIQVQKAKVDIDQALSGIDKLLKSQELTFAFVGVAPAFAVVYTTGGIFRRLLFGGRGKARYGGHHARSGAWHALRRVERLLLTQPVSDTPSQKVEPLTTGLLLISMTRLRTYAEAHLPPNSRLRQGFLEDVGDLEDADVGREDKVRIVERMWRCWSKTLGWRDIAA